MMRNFTAGLEVLAQVQPSAQATSRALERVRQTLMDPNRLQARRSFGRILMNSKWTKLAVAAVIVVAVLLGFHFLGSPLGSSVTFAQVIQPILNANTAVLDIVIGADDPNTPVIHDMVMGSRIRRTISNVEGNVSIIDLESGKILSLTEAKKEAVYLDRVHDRSCEGDLADRGRRGNPARRDRAWDSRNRPIKEDWIWRPRRWIPSEPSSWRWPGRPLSECLAPMDRMAW